MWIFTCSTNECINKINPVMLSEATNPVLCSACYELTDAVEALEPVSE